MMEKNKKDLLESQINAVIGGKTAEAALSEEFTPEVALDQIKGKFQKVADAAAFINEKVQGMTDLDMDDEDKVAVKLAIDTLNNYSLRESIYPLVH